MPLRIKTDPKTWSSSTPTEPVIISRLPVYAPVSRLAPNGNRSESGRRLETSWGWVELSGPVLTWEHRRILLLSKTMAKSERLWEDGSLSLWIDAYEVKQELGYANGGRDHRRFMQRLRDMKNAAMVVKNYKTGRTTESSVLWSFSYDREKPDTPAKPGIFTKTRRPKKGKEERKEEAFLGLSLFEIRISKEYMSLFGDDLRIHHDPDLIRDLVQIGDGMIASVVAFFLAHKEKCRYKIRRVLEIIGAIEEGMTKGTVSKIMAKPEKFKEELEKFGICVDGECLVYERNRRVFFTNPPPLHTGTSTGAVIDAEQGPEPASLGMALEATPKATVSLEPPEK